MTELHHQRTGLKCKNEMSAASHLHIKETVRDLKLSLAGHLLLLPLVWIVFQKHELAVAYY